MSSFGGVPIDMAGLGIDYLISSANKCIQGGPGFRFVIAKKQVFLQTEGIARSVSLNLYDQWKMMDIVVPNAKAKGYAPDHLVTPDDVGNQGRSYPSMIFENMRALGLDSVKTIIKVGDTASDIQKAMRLVYSSGVLRWVYLKKNLMR